MTEYQLKYWKKIMELENNHFAIRVTFDSGTNII